jgi:pimeloyl-ACP methyl ester carboxylesterase
MFLECTGEGEPTVILESGIHDSSEYWTVSQLLRPAVDPPVMQGLAETNRVCRYDRPGTVVPGDPPAITNRSSPVEMPRTVADSVADLHALLQAAEVPGPYVIVAHSWGGMIGQLYARSYPDDVSGLVLVDAFAPAIRDLLGDKWPAYVDVLNNPPGETLIAQPEYEKFDIDASIDEVVGAPALDAELPLVVMSKTEPFPEFPAGAGMTNADIDAVWPDAQQTLVDLLPNTPHEIATGSIHYIQVTEPDLVIDAARLVIGRAATSS